MQVKKLGELVILGFRPLLLTDVGIHLHRLVMRPWAHP